VICGAANTEEGVARDTVLRIGQAWSKRGIGQAFAIKNLLSFGLHAFGATSSPAGVADGRFFAWLAQAQWAHRVSFGRSDGQVILRSDAQFAKSPLLGLEKFAIGGHSTVRGYLENELVRDDGVIGSAELRAPIFSRNDGATSLEVAPFVDIGSGWNLHHLSGDHQTLPSAGIGLRGKLLNRLQAEIYWGHPFAERLRPLEQNLQSHGIHAGIIWKAP